MEIKNVALSQLNPYENNPRLNDQAVDAVAKSISEFGFKVPLVIDDNNIIVTGHTRYKAALQLGLSEVPVIVASDLSPEQIKAFRLVDNKTSELADWDMDLLADELSGLDDDMSDFGFNAVDFQMDSDDVIEDSDFDVTPPDEPISKSGQLWQLGRHKLFVGDATDEQSYKSLVGGGPSRFIGY